MPSKISKPRRKAPKTQADSLSRVEREFSSLELSDVAKFLGDQLKPGDIVLLEGELGVGKTTLAKSLLAQWGVQAPFAGSPTFSICNIYKTSDIKIYHMDWYRLVRPDELESSGLLEAMEEPGAIKLIEWASKLYGDKKVQSAWGGRCYKLELRFVVGKDNLRQLVFERLA